MGVRRAVCAVKMACDEAHVAVAAGYDRDVRRFQALVSRGDVFLRRGQVHPELYHFKQAARFAEGFAVEFFVDDTVAGGHPLHVAGGDGAAVAGTVAVGDFTLQGEGDGLEAGVRVRADAFRALRFVRREMLRHGVVEHEEGAGVFVALHVVKEWGDVEAVADPVAGGGGVGFFDVAQHGFLLLFKCIAWCRWLVQRAVCPG